MGKDIEISEKKLKDYIHGYLNKELYSDSLNYWLDVTRENGVVVVRQLEISPYGVADIVVFGVGPEGGCDITIFELKKGIIDTTALIQILRYKAGLIFYLNEQRIKLQTKVL